MTPDLIAQILFWVTLLCIALFVYQAIILPGIRLNLRYRVFMLRDKLRRLVIEGALPEHDHAFEILHERLNDMCVSIHRYDLARVVHAARTLDGETRARVEQKVKIIMGSTQEVQEIYKESLAVIGAALAFNSFFLFCFGSIVFVVALLLKSIYSLMKKASLGGLLGLAGLVRELFQKRVDDDKTVAFFSPELATV